MTEKEDWKVVGRDDGWVVDGIGCVTEHGLEVREGRLKLTQLCPSIYPCLHLFDFGNVPPANVQNNHPLLFPLTTTTTQLLRKQ